MLHNYSSCSILHAAVRENYYAARYQFNFSRFKSSVKSYDSMDTESWVMSGPLITDVGVQENNEIEHQKDMRL